MSYINSEGPYYTVHLDRPIRIVSLVIDIFSKQAIKARITMHG